MTQDYQGQPVPPPPVPPPSLGLEWRDAMWAEGIPTTSIPRELATRAAAWAWEQAMATLAEREQAAADAELQACCAWLEDTDCDDPQETARRLRAARSPRPCPRKGSQRW